MAVAELPRAEMAPDSVDRARKRGGRKKMARGHATARAGWLAGGAGSERGRGGQERLPSDFHPTVDNRWGFGRERGGAVRAGSGRKGEEVGRSEVNSAQKTF